MIKNFITNEEIIAFHKLMDWEIPLINKNHFVCECVGPKIGYFCSIWIDRSHFSRDAIFSHEEKHKIAKEYLSLIGRDFRQYVGDSGVVDL